MSQHIVELSELMVSRAGSIDPKKHPHETFELFSVPAYDRGASDVVDGVSIGSSKQRIEPGDVMLSKIVPHIRRAWIVPDSSTLRQVASGEWILFRDRRIHGPYFRHLLISDQFNRKFMQTIAGVGGSLLRARPAHVARIKIPLPPIDEQRRIAAILDKADELRTKRRQALARLDVLTQSVFHELFGDANASRGTTIADCAEVQGGLQVSRRRASLPLEVPYLRVANVHRGYLDLSEIKTMQVTEAELDRVKLHTGDLLIVEGHGNASEIGRCARWSGSENDVIHQNHLIRVRFNPADIHPVFGEHYLNSIHGRWHLLKSAKTTSGLNTISSNNVKEAPMAKPPIAHQHRFAERISAIERLRVQQRAQLAALDTLFASLQHRAFEGKL